MRFWSVVGSLIFLLALALVLSMGAVAHEGSAVEVSGGVYLGDRKAPGEESRAFGLYVSAEAAVPKHPVAVSSSFATFSSDEVTVSGSTKSLKHTVSVFDLLAGYRVFDDFAVGAGWASYNFDAGSDKETANGFVVGAFGKFPFTEGLQVSGKIYFAPAARYDDEDATMVGFSATGEHALTQSLGIEIGYRYLQVNLKDDKNADTTTGGLFLGVTYAF